MMVGLVVVGLALVQTGNASARLLEDLTIHGFGGSSYGRTDNENVYLMGNKKGSYDEASFSLNLSASLGNGIRVYLQPSFTEDWEGSEVTLDYGFAEWRFTDTQAIRIGKIKASFMSYNEIHDVGTLRPFYTLPVSVYADFSAESYQGISLTGNLYAAHGWEVNYDLYGGKGELPRRKLFTIEVGRTEDDLYYLVGNGYLRATIFGEELFGGRITVGTPVPGLSGSVSFYSARVGLRVRDVFLDGRYYDRYEEIYGRYYLPAISLEYVNHPWSIRLEGVSEIAREDSGQVNNTAAYLEVARMLPWRFQAAFRWEVEECKPDGGSSLDDHRDLAVGLNYWFNRNFVLKMSLHHVTGNRFAQPEDPMVYFENLVYDSFEETTNLVVCGAQFSF